MAHHVYLQGNRFDSELVLTRCSPTRNAELVLHVKFWIDFYNPPGHHFATGDGYEYTESSGGIPQTVRVVDWTLDQKDEFRERFRDQVQRAYNTPAAGHGGGLWLAPSADWGCRVGPPAGYHRPNVRCLLRLIPAEGGESPHLRIRCVRLAAGEFYRSSAALAPHHDRTSLRMWLDHTDVDVPAASGGLRQVVAAHEMGHFLYLCHPGHSAWVAAGGDDNEHAPSPYGEPGSPEESSLMGRGMTLTPSAGRAWKDRLTRHLERSLVASGLTWRVITRYRSPVAVRRQVVTGLRAIW